MRKGKTVIGQGVYSLEDGIHIDSVKDLLINDANDAIVALLVDQGGMMETSKVIPMRDVHRFGPSAVMVSRSSVVVDADAVPEVRDILDREATLLDRAVLTREGEDLGRIRDMYFDEDTGRILGFEVSGGRLGDMMRGTSYLARDEIEVVGPDAVITSVETKAHLEAQKGGLAAAVEDAQGRAGEMQAQLQTSAEQAQDPDGTLVGRRSRSDVSDPTGSIILANGQRVALEDVQRARDAGVIDELYAATGVRRRRPASEEAGDMADEMAHNAQDLWDRFTHRVSALTDDAGRRMDAEQTKRRLAQIHDAIGRPVTKVILDRADEVILDVGDIVTHQAIQRAHENGMLDTLLDSVYVAEVTFDREELRAHVPGQARIEEAHGGARLVDELEQRRGELEAQPSGGGNRDAETGGAEGKKVAETGGAPEAAAGSGAAGRSSRRPPARIDVEVEGTPTRR